jgi:hypothetical protein
LLRTEMPNFLDHEWRTVMLGSRKMSINGEEIVSHAHDTFEQGLKISESYITILINILYY